MDSLISILKASLGIFLGVVLAFLLFRHELPVPQTAVAAFQIKTPTLTTPFGDIQIETKEVQGKRVLEVTCIACSVASSALARTPLTNQGAKLIGRYDEGHFVGELQSKDVSIPIDARLSGTNIALNFVLPRTSVASLYEQLGPIIPESGVAKIKGNISGKGSCSWPDLAFTFEPKVSEFEVSNLFTGSAYKSGTFTYYGRNSKRERVLRRSGEGTPQWLPLSAIGELLPAAVVSAEDFSFYGHSGYHLASMLEAAQDNKEAGRLRRGGSTLTQQLAKNLFLDEEKTYARKLRELLYAVQLERELSKQRIIELYLNIVEWGPDVVGAKKAANTYFGKDPAMLLPEEAAWLASILRSPVRGYNRQFLKNSAERRWVSTILRRMKGLTDEQRSAALERPVVFKQPL